MRFIGGFLVILDKYTAHGKIGTGHIRTTAGLLDFQECIFRDGGVSPGIYADHRLALDKFDRGVTVANAP
jgi:hypothetical protein